MERVRVRAVEGRVAFTAPTGGVKIPSDKSIRVERTPWIERLLTHYQDIVLVDETPEATKKPKATAKTENLL